VSPIGEACGTEGVSEWWSVEDVTVENPGHPNLCLHLEMQASCVPWEQDGAPRATCEKTSANTTKSKGEKRDMTALERVWR
jgi:hypothetical protein